jgi:hypothetical protein
MVPIMRVDIVDADGDDERIDGDDELRDGDDELDSDDDDERADYYGIGVVVV